MQLLDRERRPVRATIAPAIAPPPSSSLGSSPSPLSPTPCPAVSISKTKSDRANLKRGLVDSVRESVDRYKYAYVVAYENMRTSLCVERQGGGGREEGQ
jgi:hypothetical protein